MLRNIPFVSITLILATGLFAGEPQELRTARSEYERSAPHPDELARTRYVTGLIKLRDQFARSNATASWQAVDAELKRHPAPKDSDARALSKLMAGKWISPRHEYLFRKDGTWTMDPSEPGIAHGRWHIEGNQFYQLHDADGAKDRPDTIILLDHQNFVTTDGDMVFYENREGK